VSAEVDGALGDWPHVTEHFGSTSVPALVAKPIIDVLVGVDAADLGNENLHHALAGLGFRRVPATSSVDRKLFIRRQGSHAANVHIVEHQSDVWRGLLLFRDWLRFDARAAKEYGVLKRRLMDGRAPDYAQYRSGKGAFIAASESSAHEYFRDHNPGGSEPPSFIVHNFAYDPNPSPEPDPEPGPIPAPFPSPGPEPPTWPPDPPPQPDPPPLPPLSTSPNPNS